MKVFISWLKTNAIKIALILGAIVALLIVVLCFWLKIRGFKIEHLLSYLEIANAKNEINHLKTKKAVLKTKYQYKEQEIQEIEDKIKEEEKKAETSKLEIKGLSSEEIADHFNKLGY